MKSAKVKQSGIGRLLRLLGQTQHPYRPATEVFLDLNVGHVAAELQLTEQATERGIENRPSQDALAPDDIEHRIIERVESHKQDAHSIYLEHLHTYDDRLTSLNFEERFATIQQAAPEAVGDFRAEAALGRDELFGLRRKVCDTEQERDYFRTRHNLFRPARISTPGKTVLKVGILAILFVLEVVINGSFLAQSSMQGLLGGAVQAVSFAALNILVSFLCGLVPIRLINRHGLAKLLGLLSLVAYLVFAAGLNLTLAHLREIPPSVAVDIGREVMIRLRSGAFGLHDINSWVFFGIGFTFSIVAMADGVLFTDPYFGYGSVERRCVEAHAAYTEGKAQLIEQLREIRDTATDVMNSAARDLSIRRGEYDAIVQARGRLGQRFAEHQNQIERTCRALLTMYRDANRKARKSPSPDYFSKQFTLDRIIYTAPASDESARDKLRHSIVESQDLLKAHIKSIHEAFEEAVRSYREIDDIVPEKNSGTQTTATA